MDNFKKHLQQHLEEMDTDVPGDAVWQKIQAGAKPVIPKSQVFKMVFRYAAAACVLACIGTIFFILSKKDTATPTLAINTKDTGKQSATIVLEQPKKVGTTMPVATAESAQPVPDKITSSKNNYRIAKQPVRGKQIIKKQIIIDPSQLLIQDVEKNYAQLVNMQLERLRITPVYAESPNYLSTSSNNLSK